MKIDEVNNSQEQSQKRVVYYDALVNAWIQSRMELDKVLIFISAAGIGLLSVITEKSGSNIVFVPYSISFFSFFCVIISVCSGLNANSKYIEKLIKDGKDDDNFLSKIDYFAYICFALGMSSMMGILISRLLK